MMQLRKKQISEGNKYAQIFVEAHDYGLRGRIFQALEILFASF